MSSLENALRILDVLSRDKPVLRVGEIARDLEIPKSSVSRLLQAMSTSGLLERDPGGQGYVVGPRSVILASLYRNRFSAVDDADRAVFSLIARFGFTGYVSCLAGTEIILLRVRQGTYPLRHVREVGTRLPAFETAMGLVLLSTLPSEEQRQRYDDVVKAGQHTPPWHDVAAAVEKVRRTGTIVASSVLNPGITTVAAPMRQPFLEEVFSIAIAYPEIAVDKALERQIVEAVLDASKLA